MIKIETELVQAPRSQRKSCSLDFKIVTKLLQELLAGEPIQIFYQTIIIEDCQLARRKYCGQEVFGIFIVI